MKNSLNQLFKLNYSSIRKISSPEDTENDRIIYLGQVPVKSILGLPTDENVRSYLLEAEGKQRRRPTDVHKAIKETLLNYPTNFSVLNSGITIIARKAEIDENSKVVTLTSPSIINGAQTQGVLKDLDKQGLLPVAHVKVEIIITTDDDLVGEISIARNFQNDVMSISIAGRKGQLDELEEKIIANLPDRRLRKSETQLPNDVVIDTEKLLQVIIALIPQELWYKPGETDSPNKVFCYNAKAKCLKDFQYIYVKAKDQSDIEHQKFFDIYQFFLDIAPKAYDTYTKWKSHNGFKGTGLRALERDSNNDIVEVPDGIIFPIIASLSLFVQKTDKGWDLIPPSIFRDEELIRTAKSIYMEMAKSNPVLMGKNKACYSALQQITSIYQRLNNVNS